MSFIHTIAAICTSPEGAIAVLRVSGPDSLKIVRKIWKSRKALGKENARLLIFGRIVFPGSELSEQCLAVYMPGPESYTGEDVVEIQCHGGSFLPGRILRALFDAGAHAAEPGEFTKRAFLNGKMDLTQAEAVADLISSKNESAACAAGRQLSGALGRKIRAVTETLSHLLAEVESRLDFPEETLDWMPEDQLIRKIHEAVGPLRTLLAGQGASGIIRDGVTLALAGSPNVGKSSLLNLLLGSDRAIVSDIPGTTRDTLCESAMIRNILVKLTDTAGIREESRDPVENLGIERSRNTLQSAEIVFWLFDASSWSEKDLERMKNSVPQRAETIVVWNKADLVPGFVPPETGHASCVISSLTGEGIDTLLDLFEKTVWGNSGKTVPECTVSVRHAKLLNDTLEYLDAAAEEIGKSEFELAASCLHNALRSATCITGESASKDVLEEIFSKFCIGK